MNRIAASMAAALLVAAVSAVLAVTVAPAGPVPALTTVAGELEACPTGYCLDGRQLDLGRLGMPAGAGDTSPAYPIGPLEGLVGSEVVLEISVDSNPARVYTVNGLPVRPFRSTPAPAVTPTTVATASATTAPPPAPGGASVLTRCGSDYCLDGTPLYFGPWWYIHHTQADHDYDGNGVIGTLAQELDGLVGRAVSVDIRMVDGAAHVLAVEGLPWRDPAGAPPWTGGPSFGGDDDDEDDDGPPAGIPGDVPENPGPP